MSAKAKPKRVRERPEDIDVGHSKPTTRGKIVRVQEDPLALKVPGNGKVPRRRNPAKKTKKKTKTANELMLEAWQYIWENRHRRLTKP